MAVLQKAVVAADRGEVNHPSELLDEMQERFMIHDTLSPLKRANRLGMYGKKVHDSISCGVYIE